MHAEDENADTDTETQKPPYYDESSALDAPQVVLLKFNSLDSPVKDQDDQQIDKSVWAESNTDAINERISDQLLDSHVESMEPCDELAQKDTPERVSTSVENENSELNKSDTPKEDIKHAVQAFYSRPHSNQSSITPWVVHVNESHSNMVSLQDNEDFMDISIKGKNLKKVPDHKHKLPSGRVSSGYLRQQKVEYPFHYLFFKIIRCFLFSFIYSLFISFICHPKL